MNFLRVHHTQTSIGSLDIVQVLDCSLQSTHNHLAMLSHFGVSLDGSGAGQVTKGSEVPLGPWSDDQKSETKKNQSLRSDFIDTDLSPQASDGAPLGICPHNHSDGLEFLRTLLEDVRYKSPAQYRTRAQFIHLKRPHPPERARFDWPMSFCL
uniref:Uncharacterized protein n=1 Tax=Astyanax mexicanus TaxID=7994 RepID=A0A8B9HCL3_ASTMX